MEYIIILEKNKKEDETYIFYCQWTGNELELEKLIHVIKTANAEDLYDDVAIFEVSRTRIPESAVNVHISIKDFGSYTNMFQKCEGTFTCPNFSEDPHEKAIGLDDKFFGGRLPKFFGK